MSNGSSIWVQRIKRYKRSVWRGSNTRASSLSRIGSDKRFERRIFLMAFGRFEESEDWRGCAKREKGGFRHFRPLGPTREIPWRVLLRFWGEKSKNWVSQTEERRSRVLRGVLSGRLWGRSKSAKSVSIGDGVGWSGKKLLTDADIYTAYISTTRTLSHENIMLNIDGKSTQQCA